MKKELRSITDLLKLDGRVFVYLKDESVCRRFFMQAEKEGFTFAGAKPGSLPSDDVIAVNTDKTLSFVGFNGHMAFLGAEQINGRHLIRIDYERYEEGSLNFYMSAPKNGS